MFGTAMLLLAPSAQAWNPYPDVSNPPPEERHWSQPQTLSRPTAPLMRQAPVYRATAYTPPPTVYPVPLAPTAQVYTPPAPPAYTPPPMPATIAEDAPRYVPAEQSALPAESVASAPIYTPPPTQDYAAPTPYDSYPESAPAPATQIAASNYGYTAPAPTGPTHHWSLGFDGFYDRYREPSLNLETEGTYYGMNASYEFYSRRMEDLYSGIDLRASIGESDYESGSGTIEGLDESEYEARWKIGISTIRDGRGVVPYTGLGARYYRMDGKDVVSSLGAQGYDRNIFQVYIPVGVNLHTQLGGWNIRSNLEYDHLFAGWVSSRLGTIPGYENAMNHQDSGFGLRAELLAGQTYDNGMGFVIGPFLRYWDVDDSKTDSQAAGTFYEPQNDRLHAGVTAKFLF